MRAASLSKSRSGIWVFGCGGGSYTSTYGGRWATDKDFNLKGAIYVRTRGDLACVCDQVGVPIQIDDIIWIAKGRLPFHRSHVERLQVIDILPVDKAVDIPLEPIVVNGRAHWGMTEPEGYAILEPLALDTSFEVPTNIRHALETYHNRSGAAFATIIQWPHGAEHRQ